MRRAEERVLIDRLTWLATAASNSQARAVASLRLSALADRFKGEPATTEEGDRAQHALLAADIRRFLERPAPTAAIAPAAPQPPGAPIGDPGMDFLGLPACGWIAPYLER